MANRASLYGPVPIAALPELKSSVLAFAYCLLMIAICVMSDGISGYGCAVLKRIVYGSTTSILVICFVYAVNGDGLFGTFGTRSIDATTSAAVKSLPSWNFTPLRSLNSHVVAIDRLPLGREARHRLRLLVALDEIAVEVRRDVVVGRQVVIVRVGGGDVGAETDRQVRGRQRQREGGRRECGGEPSE